MCVHNQGVNRTEMPGMPGRDVTMLAATTEGGIQREQLKSSLCFSLEFLKRPDKKEEWKGEGGR